MDSLRFAELAQEIAWIERKIENEILSPEIILEYRQQIRRKEREIAYLRAAKGEKG